MASLTPLAIAECSVAIADVSASLATEPPPERPEALRLLRSLHEILIRATRGVAEPPLPELQSAADAAAAVARQTADALAPRQRTVYRLLRAGAFTAAWEVLVDNGTGLVDEGYAASTATGAARTSPRLPLLTRVERGTVYAELPGFRDPRYAAPDDCYDITTAVRAKGQLDELTVVGSRLTLAGWTALEVLVAGEHERIAVVATSAGREMAWPARRVRRPDLVSGRGEALARRAWAGFAAHVDLAAADLALGEWAVWVEIEHQGLVQRYPLGRDSSALAAAGARTPITVGSRQIRWQTSKKQWSLLVS